MMQKLLLITLLVSLVAGSSAQVSKISIRGSVTDEKGEPIVGCNIIVTKKSSPLIVAYTTTGGSNFYALGFDVAAADSFIIKASHTGYITNTATLRLPDNGVSSFTVNFKLALHAVQLSEVIVPPPAIWKNGDTTFYRADAFKEGEEKKLIDLVAKLPDFKLDEKGLLTYKRIPINKLTVGGTELFADKVQLLLKNIPVHVINTIQAIENQSSSTVLKGLASGGEIVVNVGLKKNKANSVFGDWEVGAATNGNYKVNPVLFSLLGKFKAGLISNWNTTGESLTEWELYQVKSKAMYHAGMRMMHLNNLTYLMNFSDRRYMRNRQVDNRLQFNLVNSKKIKSQLEFTWLNENKRQQSGSVTSNYLNALLFKENRALNSQYIPGFFSIRNKTTLAASSTAELNVQTIYEYDYSRNEKTMSFTQDTFAYATLNNIKNRWRGVSIAADYTRRQSATKAITITAYYSNHRLAQFATGLSKDWAAFFALPNDKYDRLQQQMNNRAAITTGVSIKQIKRTPKKVQRIGISTDWQSANLFAPLSFESSDGTAPVLHNSNYTRRGRYFINSSFFSWASNIRLLRIEAEAEAKLGFYAIGGSQQDHRLATTAKPLIDLSLSSRSQQTDKLRPYWSLFFSQSPVSIHELASQVFPTGIGQYNRYVNPTVPRTTLNILFGKYLQPKDYLNIHLSVNGIVSFTNNLFMPVNSGFVYVFTINNVAKRTASINFDAKVIFPWVALKTKVTFSGSIGVSEALLRIDNDISKQQLYQPKFFIQLKRNWNKKVFVDLNINYATDITKLPNRYKVEYSGNPTYWLSKLNARFLVIKNVELKAVAEWVYNRLNNISKYSAILADAELSYKFPKKRFNITARVENIGNERQYININNIVGVNQTIYTIPLIARNLFLGLRYEL
jgi:hypothetical protein